MKPILVLSGTNRPGSNTRKMAALVHGCYQKQGTPVALLDLADLPSEILSPSSYAEKPATFVKFSEAVLGSSGVVVVTPEYNGSFPGILKYFIDMLPFPESFENRPVCFVGLAAGMWGALRSVEQLQVILGYRNAFIYPERVFIPGIGWVLEADGTLKDAKLAERLQAQASGFAAFVQKFQVA